jgi:hypothetical protein
MSKLIGQGIKLRPVEFLPFADNGRFLGILGGGRLKQQTQGGFFFVCWGLKEYQCGCGLEKIPYHTEKLKKLVHYRPLD